MKRRALPVALSCLSLFLASCGDSYQEVAARHQATLDTLREDMAKLSELVAANPEEMSAEMPLDPAPVFKQDDSAASNTVAVVWERLTDPSTQVDEKTAIDLYLSNGLENLFTWATWDMKAADNFEADLKNAAALRYLVSYKPLKLNPPQVDAEFNYTIGSVAMGVYVYDRQKKEIVRAFPVVAMSGARVGYQYRKDGSNQLQAARDWARSSLWENLRPAVTKALAERTGGTFEK